MYLDKIKSFFHKFTSKIGNRNFLFISLAILIIFTSIYFIYKTFFTSKKENFDSNSPGNKQAELMLFYANWCPHCKECKPDWFSLKEQMNGKSMNGYNVLFTEVDCTEKTDEVEKKQSRFNIEGYPTVLLLKDGRKIDFDGKPTKETLQEFLQANL